MPFHQFSLSEFEQGFAQKKFSPAEVHEHFRSRIDKFNPALNAIINNDNSQINAQKLYTRAPLENSPLSGIPVIHKDIFCTAGIRTTAGSKILDNFISPYSAHIVEELANAGAVTIAKANLDEFAMGSNNENSAFGKAYNPWNLEYCPGGSSGGSAIAVASGLAPFSTGSDTGGSIRTPASHCGVTGIKPSYGTVSRYGMIAYASSLDQAGVFARRAEDCAKVLEVMMHFDERDSTQIPMNKRALDSHHLSKNLSNSLKGKKIGVCANLIKGINEEIKAPINDGIKSLTDLGLIPVEVDFKYLEEALAAYYIIATAEASSNLSRFDGIRYGYRAPDQNKLEDVYAVSRTEGFGAEVKRRILLGTFVLSHGYYDAYYLSALKVRRLIVNMFNDLFSQCDFLALPNSPLPPTKIGSINSPVEEYLMDVFTVPINLAGLPALSMPVGFTANNLPVGLQLTAPYFSEALLLNVAHQFQQNSKFHLQTPPNFN